MKTNQWIAERCKTEIGQELRTTRLLSDAINQNYEFAYKKHTYNHKANDGDDDENDEKEGRRKRWRERHRVMQRRKITMKWKSETFQNKNISQMSLITLECEMNKKKRNTQFNVNKTHTAIASVNESGCVIDKLHLNRA